MARRDSAYVLHRLALDRGDAAGAAQLAAAAMRAHRKDQTPSAPLLLGLARFWTDCGELNRTRGVLRRLAMHVAELTRADAVAAAALMARALAETEPGRSRRADARTWQLLTGDTPAEEPASFPALLDLAHAAAMRRDRPAYDRAARAALRWAPRENYGHVRDVLGALVASAFPPESKPPRPTHAARKGVA
jgi:hypothetical protein